MTNPRTLIILGVIFAALVVFSLLSGSEPAVPVSTAVPTVTIEAIPTGTLLRVFPDLRVVDIQAIRLDDLVNGRALTLTRDADGGWIAPELDAELDDEQASSIARTMVLFPYASSINIVPNTDFERYGLTENPQMMLQILKTDGTSHAIAVGHLIDSERAYYVLVDERDEIFQVERGPIDFLRNLIISPPIRLTK
jgi:hypothetical protein